MIPTDGLSPMGGLHASGKKTQSFFVSMSVADEFCSHLAVGFAPFLPHEAVLLTTVPDCMDTDSNAMLVVKYVLAMKLRLKVLKL